MSRESDHRYRKQRGARRLYGNNRYTCAVHLTVENCTRQNAGAHFGSWPTNRVIALLRRSALCASALRGGFQGREINASQRLLARFCFWVPSSVPGRTQDFCQVGRGDNYGKKEELAHRFDIITLHADTQVCQQSYEPRSENAIARNIARYKSWSAYHAILPLTQGA